MSKKKSLTLPFKKASKHEKLVAEREKTKYDFTRLRQWFANLSERRKYATPDELRIMRKERAVPYMGLEEVPLDDGFHECPLHVDTNSRVPLTSVRTTVNNCLN